MDYFSYTHATDANSTFVLLLIVVGICVIGMIVTAYRRWKADMNASEETVKATVVDKRSSTISRHYDSRRHRNAQFYITFRTEDGERIELQVSQADYIAILADAEGYLTYKGGRLVDFKRISADVTE